MNTREVVTIEEDKTAPAFGGMLYIGCIDINKPTSEVTINVSSLEQAHEKFKIKTGEIAKYTVQGIAQFAIRVDSVFYAPYPYGRAKLVVTMLENLTFAHPSNVSSVPNVKFNESEIKAIRSMLFELNSSIDTKYSPKQSTRQKIRSRIESASADLESANRIDWARIFVSTMIGVSLDLGFSNDFPEFLMAATRRVIETIAQISAEYFLTKRA